MDFDIDEPFMLFTGKGDKDACDHIPDDIYEAMWLPGSQLWDVNYSTSPDCPTYEFVDDHDPYILPLPNGGFKAYYNDTLADQTAVVCYSDDGAPGTWEDCVEIEMGFDDGSPWNGLPTDPHKCVGDTEMFAYQDGGTRHEGGFTVPQDCFTPESGIIFIEHMN